MPRLCSSGRRSVSLPVSALISAVLPWSMWPAVPSVSGASVKRLDNSVGCDARLVVGERARIQKQPAVTRAADDRRICGTQPARQLVRAELAGIHGTDRTLQLEQRQRPTTDLRRGANDARPRRLGG